MLFGLAIWICSLEIAIGEFKSQLITYVSCSGTFSYSTTTVTRKIKQSVLSNSYHVRCAVSSMLITKAKRKHKLFPMASQRQTNNSSHRCIYSWQFVALLSCRESWIMLLADDAWAMLENPPPAPKAVQAEHKIYISYRNSKSDCKQTSGSKWFPCRFIFFLSCIINECFIRQMFWIWQFE